MLLDCMYDTNCSNGGSSNCYCGTGDCPAGGANGACLLQVQAASEGTTFADVSGRFLDLTYAVGWATNRIDNGNTSGCSGVCGSF
jgi:hypothetical protein